MSNAIGEDIEKYFLGLYGIFNNKKLKIKKYTTIADDLLKDEDKNEFVDKVKNLVDNFPKTSSRKKRYNSKKNKRTGNLIKTEWNYDDQEFTFEFDEDKDTSENMKTEWNYENQEFTFYFGDFEPEKKTYKFDEFEDKTKKKLLKKYRRIYFDKNESLLDEKGKTLDELIVLYHDKIK